MDKKLRQVTDNIHGTIYLSKFESELISTPYFYRLHDIYQSSTVYMTFPSNRTKRYEHSLGTMELASTMLFSSVSNASVKTRRMLFKKLNNFFKEILDLAILRYGEQTAPYFTQNSKEDLGQLFGEIIMDDNQVEEAIFEDIKDAVINGAFMDSALDHFQLQVDEVYNNANEFQNVFLYRCLLQAERIVALFHDVGHPPYSHIIEEALEELYKECSDEKNKKTWNKKKLNVFFQCMERYATDEPDRAYSCQTLYSKSSLIDAHLHERVGLSLFQSAINDTVPELIGKILTSSKSKSIKRTQILYYVMIVELAIAILVEKNSFFKSFHTLVDGIIDADRLDYIMRDSLNSGIDWGKIPYKRLINSAKLMHASECNELRSVEDEENIFIFAYPQKVTDDIEDLLLVRYKIFARINFHHRCMKTATAIKTTIVKLAEDYLSKDDNTKCINADICMLWTSLGMGVGDRKNRVILWNDSWLISTLHRALVNLNLSEERKNRLLKEDLEEILLNKKRYYSLLKRGSDSRRFVEQAFLHAGISKDNLIELKNKEYEKYYRNMYEKIEDTEILKASKTDALDSLLRIELLEYMLNTGDLEPFFNSPVPFMKENGIEIIDNELCQMKKEGIITDYKTIENKGRKKTGLPRQEDVFDEIYLYVGNDAFAHNQNNILKQQIDAIERNVPWLYIYFVPGSSNNVNLVASCILERLSNAIGERLKERYVELFGNSH